MSFLITLKTKNTLQSNDKSKETLLVNDSSTDESVPEELKVTEEEKRGTIPGSTTVTAAAIMCTHARANPLVGQGPPCKVDKKKIKVSSGDLAMQTK